MKFANKKLLSISYLILLLINVLVSTQVKTNVSSLNQNSSLLNSSKSQESNSTNMEMTSHALLERANAQLKAQTNARLQTLNDKLEKIEKVKKIIKKGVQDKLKVLITAVKSAELGKLNKKSLKKYSQTISKGVKVLEKVEKKSNKKVSKLTQNLKNIANVIQKQSAFLQKASQNKKNLAITMNKNADNLLKNYKKKSKEQKINGVRDLKTSGKKLDQIVKKEKKLKYIVQKIRQRKRKIEKKIKKESKAFKHLFLKMFSKINVALSKENKEADALQKKVTDPKENEKKIKKEVQALLKKDKNEKPLSDSQKQEKLKKIDQESNKTSPTNITNKKKKAKAVPTSIVFDIKKHSNKSSVKEAKKQIAKEDKKNDHIDTRTHKLKSKKQIVKEALKKKEKKDKKKEKLVKKGVLDEKDEIKKTEDEDPLKEAFEINEDVKDLRKKVIGNIQKTYNFLENRKLHENIHSLIVDQDALKHLVTQSLEKTDDRIRDVRTRSIRILRNYHEKMKNLKKEEQDVKDEIEIYKASEILNLNSMKLTGLLWDIKHLNQNYKHHKVKDNSVYPKGSDLEDKVKISSANKSMDGNFGVNDKTIKKEIDNIFKKRSETLKVKKGRFADAVEDLSNEDSLSFLQKETKITENLMHDLLLNNNDLNNKYQKVQKELDIIKKDAPEKLNILLEQVENNKKLVSSLDAQLSYYKGVSSDERDFIAALTKKINKAKFDNIVSYEKLLLQLKNKNSLIQKEEKEISHDFKEELKHKNQNYLSLIQKEEKEFKELKESNEKIQKLQREESDLKSKIKQLEKTKTKVSELEKEQKDYQDLIKILAKENKEQKGTVDDLKDKLRQVKTNKFVMKKKIYDSPRKKKDMATQETAKKLSRKY